MISGIDLTKTEKYTLSFDKENPTIWELGILPSDVLGNISTKTAEVGEIATAYAILSVSLKGWENFTQAYRTEKQTVCGRQIDAVPMELLSTIPLRAVTELTKKCMQLNGLTEDESKN